MAKSPDAFRTISEVSEWLDTPAHVLRFWESKFSQIKPVKRAGGRRYYRPQDMELLGGIKTLLHDDGMTIKGVQKLLREKGVKHVAGLGPALDADTDAETIEVAATSLPASAPTTTAAPMPTPPSAAEIVQTAALQARVASPEPVPDDPSDEDFNPPGRFYAAFHRADRGQLRRKAARIAPLVARLEAVRANYARD